MPGLCLNPAAQQRTGAPLKGGRVTLSWTVSASAQMLR